MSIIDQNSILQSLDQALVPGETLVDGRNERERLSFFADFASLINFFDHTNTINGTWRPFLLKDPVFLLAHISTFRFDKWQKLYTDEMTRLSKSIEADADIKVLSGIINHLFNQLTDIFMCIERWTFYMQQSFDYDLKKYVLREVKNSFSEYFWAVISLREAVFLCAPESELYPVKYYLFESYDDIIWKRSRGRRPFWNVLLQVEDSPLSQTASEIDNIKNCYPALKNAGNEVFSFLNTIVSHAPAEYDRVKKHKSKYPDTTLLRTFERLLRIYQKEQNKLSQKHLQFYYRDILKQKPRPAMADQVYLCADLANPAAAWTLPAGTLLDAGTDAQNNPATFVSMEDTSLNPATIVGAYTLAVEPEGGKLVSLFLQPSPSPAVLTVNEQGTITGWDTFGGSFSPTAVRVNAGLIIANPLFLLQEGDRTITCTMIFNNAVELAFLHKGKLYLSTTNAWLDVTMLSEFSQNPTNSQQVTLMISLPASQPAIVPFPVNPEGANSQWPMLKMAFSQFTDPASPPVLTQISIEVSAAKLKNLQLYNDTGALNPKAPFPLFGTIAANNSQFMIGSAEIFSKPLQSFYLELDWDSLPDSFQVYYQSYNDYIFDISQQAAADAAAAAAAANAAAAAAQASQSAAAAAASATAAYAAEYQANIEESMFIITAAQAAIAANAAAAANTAATAAVNAAATAITEAQAAMVAAASGLDSSAMTHAANANAATLVAVTQAGIAAVEAAKAEAAASDRSGSSKIQGIRNPKKQIEKKSIVHKLLGVFINPVKNVGRLLGMVAKPAYHIFGKWVSDSETSTAPVTATLKVLPPNSKPFNNVCFTVSFSMLDTQCWNRMNVTKMSRSVDDSGNVRFMPYATDCGCLPVTGGAPPLFDTTSTGTANIPCQLMNGSYFGVTTPLFPFTPDPTLQQLLPFAYSAKSSSGFIKMTLTGPRYGFGTALYSNVVSHIALENAVIIANGIKTPPAAARKTPANPPYVPKVADIKAHYSASATYVFNLAKEHYPLQCFLFSPMAAGIIYDNSPAASATASTNITSMPGSTAIAGSVPMYPAFPFEGALFLQLKNVLAPAALSLYFELARSIGKIPQGNNCHFSYLNNAGWNQLPVLNDGTSQFSCSGIVEVDLPEDISATATFMGVNNYWISIGVSCNPSVFAKTVFLKTNGFAAQRSGSSFLSDTKVPLLAPAVITKSVSALPQVTAFLQPFGSFGGKAAEDKTGMNQRVSNRLKTKDRAVTAEDFYRLIRFAYPGIFYVKTVFDRQTNRTVVYVIKAIDDQTSPNVYLPLVTECMLADMQAFLQQRTSVFSLVQVANFDLQFLRIHADIEIGGGYQIEGISKQINEGLNIFLSPWIASDTAQIKIDCGISDAEVAAFISTIDGVLSVTDIFFETIRIGKGAEKIIQTKGTILPPNNTTLFVSAMYHQIKVTLEPITKESLLTA